MRCLIESQVRSVVPVSGASL